MTLIAEDLLLLLLDERKGTVSAWAHTTEVLGGAVLAELALAGLVGVEEHESFWKRDKVHTLAAGVPADLDPVLVEALSTIAAKDRSPSSLVGPLGKRLDQQLAERLADKGILERADGKVLGLFPRTRWPAKDTLHEATLRRAITVCLANDARPDPRTGALIALLSAIDRAHTAVTPGTVLNRRQVAKRAKEIAKGYWAAKAVKDAVAAQAAASGV